MDRRTALTHLQQSGALSPVDLHLAEFIARVTGQSRWETLLATALAGQWPRRGHVCLDLASLEQEQLWDSVDHLPADRHLQLPTLSSWLDALSHFPAVGDPDATTPLVLWQDRWLYLRRYWDWEEEIEHRLHSWMDKGKLPVDEARVHGIIAQLFRGEHFDREDAQQRAASSAAQHPCSILTGGPGTGKTTTVLRILALLLHLQPDLCIALAAPTGKAALRLQDSVALGIDALPCPQAIKEKLPRSAQTLHRLLGYQRHRTNFRHDATHPLPHDFVVVDEASMMDIGLMAKLLRALKPEARLLLVGDHNQLPSVDAGAVFGTLCSDDSPVPRAELTRNYRFSSHTGIGALATAIRLGDAEAAEDVLAEPTDSSCALEALPGANQMAEPLWTVFGGLLQRLADAGDPEPAFAALDTLRVLCAHRTGPYGSEAVNQIVHHLLVSRLDHKWQPRWFPGRPILITENDYNVDLFNGDTGIILPWRGKLRAVFRALDGTFRHLSPARLPSHESAYAMTIHKSQGSEFEEVLLILSDQPTRLLTRELLYTGVTRARARVRIWSPSSSLRACLERPRQRTSGMPARFQMWENPGTTRSRELLR